MSTKIFEEFLNTHHIHYEKIPHACTYTAQETAAAAHVPGRVFAKTVMVRLDDRMVMVVLPAHYRIELDFIQKISGGQVGAVGRRNRVQGPVPGLRSGGNAAVRQPLRHRCLGG